MLDPREEVFGKIAYLTSSVLRPKSRGRRLAAAITRTPLAGRVGTPIPTELRLPQEALSVLGELIEKGALSFRTGVHVKHLETPEAKRVLDQLVRRELVVAKRDRTGRLRYYVNKQKAQRLGLL